MLNAARWDADAVRDDLRRYVVEHLGDENSGVLIVDANLLTNRAKHGRHDCEKGRLVVAAMHRPKFPL